MHISAKWIFTAVLLIYYRTLANCISNDVIATKAKYLTKPILVTLYLTGLGGRWLGEGDGLGDGDGIGDGEGSGREMGFGEGDGLGE